MGANAAQRLAAEAPLASCSVNLPAAHRPHPVLLAYAASDGARHLPLHQLSPTVASCAASPPTRLQRLSARAMYRAIQGLGPEFPPPAGESGGSGVAGRPLGCSSLLEKILECEHCSVSGLMLPVQPPRGGWVGRWVPGRLPTCLALLRSHSTSFLRSNLSPTLQPSSSSFRLPTPAP